MSELLYGAYGALDRDPALLCLGENSFCIGLAAEVLAGTHTHVELRGQCVIASGIGIRRIEHNNGDARGVGALRRSPESLPDPGR